MRSLDARERLANADVRDVLRDDLRLAIGLSSPLSYVEEDVAETDEAEEEETPRYDCLELRPLSSESLLLAPEG